MENITKMNLQYHYIFNFQKIILNTESITIYSKSEKMFLHYKTIDLFNITVNGNRETDFTINIYSFAMKSKKRRMIVDSFLYDGREDENYKLLLDFVKLFFKVVFNIENDDPITNYNLLKRKALLLINPIGGDGTTIKKYNMRIKPVLDSAYLTYEEVITTSADFARNYAEKEFKPEKYDEILICSGDGSIHEFINGLMNRKDDWKECIKIPVGCLLGGSGCGIVCSILCDNNQPVDIDNATLYCVRGHTKPRDLALMNVEENQFYSILAMLWGFIADTDFESEGMRFLGSTRFPVIVFYINYYNNLQSIYNALFRLRTYEGTLYYIPHDDKSVIPPFDSSNIDKPKYKYLPDINQPIPEDDSRWIKREGKFTGIMSLTTSYFSVDMSINPRTTMNEGYFTIYMVNKCKKMELLNLFIAISSFFTIIICYFLNYIQLGDNKKDKLKEVLQYGKGEVIHALAYRLSVKGSYVDIDGENYNSDKTIQGEILHDAMNLLSF